MTLVQFPLRAMNGFIIHQIISISIFFSGGLSYFKGSHEALVLLVKKQIIFALLFFKNKLKQKG